jgi:threonine/homoserine/homoserine lactone efflux protein
MTGLQHYPAFLVAALLFSMTPGMDTIFILNRSIAQGVRSGICSTLGISTGVVVHTLIAAVGLSAAIAQSALAFTLVKYLGALYLVYLGIATLLKAGEHRLIAEATEHPVTASAWQDYRSGVLTNVLNPKVGLFFMAFFPQFVDPAHIQSSLPFVILGVSYAAIGLLWFLSLAWLAGSVARLLQHSRNLGTWLNRASGVAFVLMGALVAFD